MNVWCTSKAPIVVKQRYYHPGAISLSHSVISPWCPINYTLFFPNYFKFTLNNIIYTDGSIDICCRPSSSFFRNLQSQRPSPRLCGPVLFLWWFVPVLSAFCHTSCISSLKSALKWRLDRSQTFASCPWLWHACINHIVSSQRKRWAADHAPESLSIRSEIDSRLWYGEWLQGVFRGLHNTFIHIIAAVYYSTAMCIPHPWKNFSTNLLPVNLSTRWRLMSIRGQSQKKSSYAVILLFHPTVSPQTCKHHSLANNTTQTSVEL